MWYMARIGVVLMFNIPSNGRSLLQQQIRRARMLRRLAAGRISRPASSHYRTLCVNSSGYAYPKDEDTLRAMRTVS